ncbi:hypothetical protein CLV84_0702 [Neolewinella xylanilytica]|uniref:Uncharacterized protein n=1 Tax=Neolewinella xylanilytica TaxID=1514080 RepID=A0A2S6I8D5_9BACT|nr:hypothetical protein CLV84_0702 [Neolewinella xylanilytica]
MLFFSSLCFLKGEKDIAKAVGLTKDVIDTLFIILLRFYLDI